MQSQTAMPVFDLVAFDWDGENTGERVGGRAEGEDATAIRHGETPSSLSILARRGLRSTRIRKNCVLVPGIVASCCTALTNPYRGHRPGTPPVITHRVGTAEAIAKTGYVVYSCPPLENHDGEPMEVAFACGV